MLELESLKARRPHSECGPDLDALSGDMCIRASHPWQPSERMLMPGLHPRLKKSDLREGAHALKFVFCKAPPGNSALLLGLRNPEGDLNR